MKTECNHIIGTEDSDCQQSFVRAGESPHPHDIFSPFSFCPLCGAEVASLASQFQTRLQTLEAERRASEPTAEQLEAIRQEWIQEEIRKDREKWDQMGLSHVEIGPPQGRGALLNYFMHDLVRGLDIGNGNPDAFTVELDVNSLRGAYEHRPISEPFRLQSGAICVYAKNHGMRCRLSESGGIIRMELLHGSPKDVLAPATTKTDPSGAEASTSVAPTSQEPVFATEDRFTCPECGGHYFGSNSQMGTDGHR